ncbi:hypothetical protein AB0469_31810 [Streptomyces sp. NPDC093801]|uniref:hypothetical protein n=1 Tax=Streptomyces sp. NPDC093801 TaxID=3155203 RepID=UPI00344E6AB7
MDLTQLTQAEEHLRRAREGLTVAAQLLHAVADLISDHQPEQPISTMALGLAFSAAGADILAPYPRAVRDHALLKALAVEPITDQDVIAQGITGGEYALRLRQAARTV